MAGTENRASGIEGTGLFALRGFGVGEVVGKITIVREVTEEAPLREEVGEFSKHCSYPDGRVILWDAPERHVNHSCDPNAWDRQTEGNPYLVARRPIAAGEEITIDYSINITGGTGWPCNCGAERCSGEMPAEFFRLSLERQQEYRPLLADWFVERHRERVERA